jgi:hypothetical protein
MMRIGPKSLITIFVVFTLCTCIDPYSPKLRGYGSLLVVDGLITDENTSYTVKLSGTIQEQNEMPLMVSDAKVFLTDDEGNNISLNNKGKGIYKTDSTGFKGIIGRTYILHILTHNGDEYESEPCLMQSVPEIDSIYYAKEQELINNGSETSDGIRFYLDSKPGDNNHYYRWDFKETWKFKVPNPKKYEYINDSIINPVINVKEYCWTNRNSDGILIHSDYSGQADRIEKEPIFFIASDKSNRLLIQYSILIRQYSISKKEYDFWNNMKQVNESGGDIFAKQPFSVKSNIHNINNQLEQVLGYFQVSAVKQKRKTISFSDISEMNLPFFHYPCDRIEMAPKDYPWPALAPPLTWDDIYNMYASSGYSFVEPKYVPGTSELQKLVFTMPVCANCELTGTMIKPGFWVDLK